MDIKQLKYFVTIVEQMSFSKAAHKLHISQPSLSNAIKSLENELGFRILERNTRSVKLTESGEVLYERALHLLLEMVIVEKEMKEVKLIGSGELLIGMIESVKHWIPKVLHHYFKAFPDMNIKLTEVLSVTDVKNSLRKYETHVIITNQQINEEDIETVPLYNEELVLVVHESNPLVNKKRIMLSDLENEPLIVTSEGFQTREDILEAFKSENVKPMIKFEIDRFETALSLVSENLGISLIPENYLEGNQKDNVKSMTINTPALDRKVYLTYKKNRYVSPAIHAFINETKRFYNIHHDQPH